MTREVRQRGRSPPSPLSWSSIPNKFQLTLICSVCIVDFFQQAAIQTYLFYQLRSFEPDASDTEISFQTGVLQSVFTAAQVITGTMWGRIADSPTFGRKSVLLIGLTGQGLSCIGVAFSKTFTAAAVWRCLGGAVNATVGGVRTALAESTKKQYHSRTVLLLPLAWNIANIFGPIFGGLLSDPILHHPRWFGNNSTFGGGSVEQWLRTFPYALPNLFCAITLFADALLIWLALRETLGPIKFNRDRGIEIGESLGYHVKTVFFQKFGYSQLSQSEVRIRPDTVDNPEVLRALFIPSIPESGFPSVGKFHTALAGMNTNRAVLEYPPTMRTVESHLQGKNQPSPLKMLPSFSLCPRQPFRKAGTMNRRFSCRHCPTRFKNLNEAKWHERSIHKQRES